MAIRAYEESYADIVADNIGTMFQYAADSGLDPIMYWNMFSSSDVARQIEKGNPRYLAGYSAAELLNIVINTTAERCAILSPESFFDRPVYYWAGWALARYQNYKGASFQNINRLLPIERVLSMYDTLHEADITKFFAVADEYIASHRDETNLKRIRTAAGLSQSQLAEKSDVAVRNIQMYEQRRNDINKAQADILARLARTLGCNIEDLFEE